MKITKVDAIQIEDKPADQPGWRPIVCRVYTDTGLYGDGEAAIAYGVGSTAAYGMIQDLAKLIIGMNPLDILIPLCSQPLNESSQSSNRLFQIFQ